MGINVNGKDYNDIAEALAAVYDAGTKLGDNTEEVKEKTQQSGVQTDGLKRGILAEMLTNYSYVAKLVDNEALPSYIVVIGNGSDDFVASQVAEAVAEDMLGTPYYFNKATLEVERNFELKPVSNVEFGGIISFLSNELDGSTGCATLTWGETPITVVNYIDVDAVAEEYEKKYDCFKGNCTCSGCYRTKADDFPAEIIAVLRFLKLLS